MMDRTKKINKLTLLTIDELNRQLSVVYRKAFDNIEKDIEELILFIAVNDEVSIKDINKFNSYLKLMGNIQREIKNIGNLEEGIIEIGLNRYNRKISKEFDKELGTETEIDNTKKILDEVWAKDGLTISDRIWKNKAILINQISDGIVNIVAKGGSVHEAIEGIKQFTKVQSTKAYYVAKRLIHTEVNRLRNAMAIERYKQAGLSQYQFHTLGDDKVCEKCDSINNKIFDISDAEVGKNLPPIHPNCRCFITPII